MAEGAVIRPAAASDIPAMVALIEQRRDRLAAYEPVMWGRSVLAASLTSSFFGHLIVQAHVIARVVERDGRIAGFALAMLQEPPPVYEPGGKTCLIDDLAMEDGADGDADALLLLDNVMASARSSGAAQVIVVAPVREERTARWLAAKGLHPASTWWTKPL